MASKMLLINPSQGRGFIDGDYKIKIDSSIAAINCFRQAKHSLAYSEKIDSFLYTENY